MYAAIKKTQNRISMLQDETGTWIGEENQIKEMVQDFFSRLLQKPSNESLTPMEYSTFPALPQTIWNNLKF